jgi:GT2 family glycosyltransferase
MSISAIVPVWNGRELLEKLLASLAAQTQPAGEVLVVDNGSSDGAPDSARERGARVISMGRNAGFAEAVNRGIRESRGEWLAVLNSDVELAPDYLARLLAEAEAAGAWFATGKILVAGSHDQIDGTFDALSRGGTAWRVGSGRSDRPAFSAARQIWSPPFTAVLLRAELFQRVGPLEASFESYLEDVDFGLRCAAGGLAGLYVPGALAWHRGSAALGRWHPETVRRMARNQVFLVARHFPGTLLARWLWPVAVAQFLWGVLALRHGAGWSWLRGIIAGMLQFLAARRAMKAEPGVAAETRRPAALARLLEENEHLIRDLQTSTGFDTYWKLYFLLTGGGTK